MDLDQLLVVAHLHVAIAIQEGIRRALEGERLCSAVLTSSLRKDIEFSK